MNSPEQKIFYASHTDDYHHIAVEILRWIGDIKIIYFYGQLGAGKTTLIKEIALKCGYNGLVQSPTYSIINIYRTATSEIYHMDLYRIEQPDQLFETGAEEYIFSGNYCFIEWPQWLESITDWPFCRIIFTVMEDGKRKITAEIIR